MDFNIEEYNSAIENVKRLANEEWLGKIINHGYFGALKVDNIEYNDSDIGNSKVVAIVTDDDNRTKLLSLGSLLKFVECSDELRNALIDAINMTEAYRQYKTKLLMAEKRRKEIAKTLKTNPNNDEFRRATKEEWMAMKEVADEPRSYGESRAVVKDDVKMYFSAAAALHDMFEYTKDNQSKGERDVAKDGDKLYSACETHGRFKGSKWRYATKEEIQYYIDNMR